MKINNKFLRFIPLILTVLFLFSACKKEKSYGSFEDGFKTYIYAYTSGVISKASPIRVRFTQSLIDVQDIGSEVATDLLSFSPAVKGKATWEDDRTILFEPSENMKSSTDFVGSVKVSEVYKNVPRDFSTFKFDFRTKDQFFEVSVEGIRSTDLSDLTKQNLLGIVFTADVAEAEAVEKILTASQKGNNNLKISWTHDSDMLNHRFVVENVNRSKEESEVKLAWNGSALDLKKKDNLSVAIPALGDFKVMDARIVQEDDQYISMTFSDPILQDQDLTGLISIQNTSTDLRFTIDNNEVRVYPSTRLTGEKRIIASRGIKNINSLGMEKPSEWALQFADIKPQVRVVGKGAIMPNSEGLVFPFEAVSLSAVDVEIFKIFENNILQFLQTNELDGANELRRVGQVVLQKKIALRTINPNADLGTWSRYALDLKDLLQREPNAIYQVRIGFQQSYSTYFCSGDNANEDGNMVALEETDNLSEDGTILSFWDRRYGWYNWDDQEDPCKEAYYKSYYRTDNFARQNVIASDIGMIAKRGEDGSYFVAISDLVTTKPLNGAKVDFYDYQQQIIKTMTADGDGVLTTKLDRKPFVIVASHNNQKGYLKVRDGYALSLSRFDVAGATPQKGLKGFLYGERGVWRPGDTLHLNFILEDKKDNLPEKHPVTFELYDPRGQLQQTMVKSENVRGIYDFTTFTAEEAPTGNWLAKIQVGGATFEQTLRIETVKPNRLKIDIDFGKVVLASGDNKIEGDLQVNWLHGSPARNLKTEVKVQLKAVNTAFSKYKGFEFDDPARQFSSTPQTIFEDEVNDDGFAKIATELNINNAAPGKLKASFTTRAFENSGEFSTDNFSLDYHPYDSYVGVSVPVKKYGGKRVDMNKDEKLQFVAVDTEGKPLKNKNISVGLYRINWRWWWENNSDNITSYNSSSHYGSVEKKDIKTNSKGEADWTINIDDWGRYLVRVCDSETGHCSGDIFYAGYPWDDNENQNRDAATMLMFSSDKEKYNVGEDVELTIPMGEEGRVLITLENGSGVVESYWKQAKKGENKFKFYVTKDMTPTVYAHVALIQPHAQAENDLPIRMYGVIPISVEDPKTRIEPMATIKDELRPEETFTVKVKEKNSKGMAYTIAIVDDGLLNLTRFKTPDPWNHFYSREALGVQTWDLYDKVIGAYGGKLERILSIGGGDGGGPMSKQKANRFKPVVMHLGPFYLKGGRTATHEIKMPNYVGSVRAMVVAADGNGAYGNFEKTIKVKKPLMVLGTLPRVLGPQEQVKLPVTVFAMKENIKNVKVEIQTNDLLNVKGSATKSVKFSKVSDKIVNFDLEVAEGVGIAKVKIIATSGKETATQEIELDIRNPNPYVTNVYDKILEAGKSWMKTFDNVGMDGTNEGILEVSNIPPIDLGKRLRYLIQYPHGCIEQTTSSGFPQLFVSKLLNPNDKQKVEIENNINATIDRIKNFQTSEGGFGYWPGDNESSSWGTNYAGHFLLEAEALGYNVPSGLMTKWKKYQSRMAKNWTPSSSEYTYYGNSADLMQAYRLYSLALADAPEWGAMNRLREKKDLTQAAKWRLAAAYAKAGKSSVAKKIVQSLPTKVKNYRELSYTYGSGLRDEAMILETLTLMKERTKAARVVKSIADELTNDSWHSTQTVSYALLAIGKYVGGGKVGAKLAFEYAIGGGRTANMGANLPMVQLDVNGDQMQNKKVQLKNTSGSVLYARLILTGQPTAGDSSSAASDMDIAINYKTLEGENLNPRWIEQGTDFIAEVTVRHPGTRGNYEEIALTQIFPSGWEIHNTRMNNVAGFTNATEPEYQDIRDDRVYSYFDMKRGAVHTYRVQLNAAYQGKFYMSTVACEAMYDNTINARKPGGWVEVGNASPAAQ